MTDLGAIDDRSARRARRARPGPVGARVARMAAREAGLAHLPLHEAVPLPEFLRARTPLSLTECRRLVQQALVLLDSVYVHLPLKRSMYAVDPVRRLRLLEHRIEQLAQAQAGRGKRRRPDDLWFHREMSDVFTSVRDLHTVYFLPHPFEGAVALLPFQVEDYFVGAQRRYVVSNVLKGLPWFKPHPDFVPGVEVTHWNGMPIARAVELAGAQNPGSNPEARHARGLARFTIRPLLRSVPPDEEWVLVQYRAPGKEGPREQRAEWRVARLPEGRDAPPEGEPLRQAVDLRHAMGLGMDVDTNSIRRVNKRLWAPEVHEEERRLEQRRRQGLRNEAPVREEREDRRFAGGRVLVTRLPGMLEGKIRRLDGKEFGYIRIRSFNVDDPDDFVEAFVALVERMPPNGLVIDVRDNGGGKIEAGERILQLLTPRRIEPERLQFINTPLNLQLCRKHETLRPWVESMERAIETGSVFSAGFPHTDPALCNDIGQRYYGPVLLVTNALCYSTTDIFAAGFQDHEIGPVLGTDGNTGAGGANVVSHGDLLAMLKAARDCPLEKLPGRANLRVAIRRTLRVGRRTGTELEDIGVRPDIHYRMTRDDVLDGNVDLIARAAALLAKKRSFELRETALRRDGGALELGLRTRNLDRVDISIDGWMSGSHGIADGEQKLRVPLPGGARPKLLALTAWRKGRLAAARKVPLD